MTNKEIAQRLRELDESGNWGGIQALADELDPPEIPHPGSIVWWKGAFFGASKEWKLGEAGDHGIFEFGSKYFIPWDEIEWKPARIAGPEEAVVTIHDLLTAVRHLDDDNTVHVRHQLLELVRDTKRMEADG